MRHQQYFAFRPLTDEATASVVSRGGMLPTIIAGGLLAYLSFLSVRTENTEPNSAFDWILTVSLPVGALLYVYLTTGYFKAKTDRDRKRLNYVNSYTGFLTATGFTLAGSLILVVWSNDNVLAITYLAAAAGIVGLSSMLYLGLFTRFSPGPGADPIAIEALRQELDTYRSLVTFAGQVITLGLASSILGGALFSDQIRSSDDSLSSEELILFTIAIASLLVSVFMGIFAPILTGIYEALTDLRVASQADSVEKAIREGR